MAVPLGHPKTAECGRRPIHLGLCPTPSVTTRNDQHLALPWPRQLMIEWYLRLLANHTTVQDLGFM